MTVYELYAVCNDWHEYTKVTVFDLDICAEIDFVGAGCLGKYGDYKVDEFSVSPLQDEIYIRVVER